MKKYRRARRLAGSTKFLERLSATSAIRFAAVAELKPPRQLKMPGSSSTIAFSLEIPHADRTSDLEDRLGVIEEKLDACLILLKKATTHDSFMYSLDDKTSEWIKAMRKADHLASA